MGTFVGRRRDLREAHDVLDAAAGGKGQLLLVSGEAGIGKTSLCDRVAEMARERGWRTAWAACWETETVPAYWPWASALGQLDVRGIFEEAGAEPANGGEGGREGARLVQFRAVLAAIDRARTDGPVVLILDDVHWADRPSVRLLAFIASQLRILPLVLVVAYRESEAMPGTPLGDVLATLLRTGRHLALRGLAPAEIEELIEELTGAPVPGEAVVALHRHTGGNPLFATEVVRLVISDAARTPGDLARLNALPVPATVRDIVSAAVARLDSHARHLLELAATAGDEFGVDVVATAAALPAVEVVEALDAALVARLVQEGPSGRYRFAHPLVRAALYESLPASRRLQFHAGVGEALEHLAAQGAPPDVAALAYHFGRAAPGGTAARGVAYARTAAEEAMSRLAYEEAARLLELALSVLSLAPQAADRIELLLALGDAQLAGGDLTAARETHLEAAAAARAAGRVEDLARAALGVGGGGGFEIALFDDEQVRLLEAALSELPSQPSALRARVAARLSVTLSYRGADERRRALSEESLAAARSARDASALIEALAAHCDAIAGPEGCEQRGEEAGEIVELAVALGDRRAELLGRRLRLVALLEMGDVAGVDEERAAYETTAAVIRQPLYGWYGPLWRAMRALMAGRLDDQARALAEARVVGEMAHSHNADLLAGAQELTRRVDAGEHEGLVAWFDGATRDQPVAALFVGVARAAVLACEGRMEESRALLDRYASEIQAWAPDSEWLPAMAQVAETVGRLGDHPLAGWASTALVPFADRWVVEGIAAACRGPVHRFLAALAAAEGDRRRAAAHFDRARDATYAAGASLLVAAVDAERERLLGPSVTASGRFRQDGDGWDVAYGGQGVRVKDAKGLHDIARLLAQPGVELHALDLMGAAVDQRSAGPVIDTAAREAYKRRVVELTGELDHADELGDAERSARLHAERDFLLGQLAAAYGLGGRERPTHAAAERARSAVTARIRDIIRRLESSHPLLGAHLREAVRTGTFCAYDPPEPVRWEL